MSKEAMGQIWTEISLSNPRDEDIKPVKVRALADTGAMMLCIPEPLACLLDLDLQLTRDVTLADGQKIKVPYAGPIRVNFENRFCFVGALVMGDDVLLGAVPMEDMDLVLNPAHRQVTVNPASPDRPRYRA